VSFRFTFFLRGRPGIDAASFGAMPSRSFCNAESMRSRSDASPVTDQISSVPKIVWRKNVGDFAADSPCELHRALVRSQPSVCAVRARALWLCFIVCERRLMNKQQIARTHSQTDGLRSDKSAVKFARTCRPRKSPTFFGQTILAHSDLVVTGDGVAPRPHRLPRCK